MDELGEKRRELTRLLDTHTRTDGTHPTLVEPLSLHRLSAPTPPVHGVLKPMFCMTAQGGKLAVLGEEAHLHDPARYMLLSVDLPLTLQITQASPEDPYLGFCLDIDPRQIGLLLLEMENAEAVGAASRGLSLTPLDAPLLDAAMRLLRLLDTPSDIPMLAPLAVREILYRLLTGEQGGRLRQMAVRGSLTERVAQAITWIKRHYAEPLSIEAVANEVCMSASGLHHHFKAVTALSPLQYQKQLRLQEARRLMLSEALDAASAGYQVGYGSPSQFSREYARLFGAPPQRDIARLRG
jgi:AraC-like DNA-binding protein